MSDEEEVMSGEEDAPAPAPAPVQRTPRAAPKKIEAAGLDEDAQELLNANVELRAKLEEEIEELRERSERRKIERAEEEKQAAKRREEEEARRKKEEEDRQSKKLAEEQERRAAREAKMAELDKYKNNATPNFVITKKAAGEVGDVGDEGEEGEKKSKEQLEAEKKAILEQRIPKLEISGFDSGKLTDKAKELHALIHRLESEKYDLEKRFKTQQYDMMELAERARQMNKVGRGGLKRVQLGQEEVDVMSERFAGCPSKILMFSPFERQKDLRKWGERKTVFTGAHFIPPPDRIAPKRMVKFNEASGQPEYEYLPGMEPTEEDEE